MLNDLEFFDIINPSLFAFITKGKSIVVYIREKVIFTWRFAPAFLELCSRSVSTL